MATVVLLGFSTAGKSTVLQHFGDTMGSALSTLDSDQEMSRDFGGHIYQLFGALVRGSDRQPALEYIERFENELLESLQPQQTPRLIAFGPAVPARSAWTSFVERVRPTAYHLALTPCEVMTGLADRRRSHMRAGLSATPAFGSWDQDVTTSYDDASGKWLALDDEQRILANIRQAMENLVPRYDSAATQQRTYRARELRVNDDLRQRFYESVSVDLLS